ncbi:hypothetical protein GNI_026840 [Gregarina niphandrodes]|uniref:Uncharacterized protein n=1 Tax=Gregarina niphandrodes TaxID=110365 RepID=A0A023BBB0_GRENI|nr:hypothetical protein GNI_026840 [Gregarina niphandrodes]EZG79374.1 hypothetical protein GNI_026840 [Gregarina niphandrodes]|eukprot:XP_011129062.1 hypothetical protein GNI_026840 [Gregarina niphandrodes]
MIPTGEQTSTPASDIVTTAIAVELTASTTAEELTTTPLTCTRTIFIQPAVPHTTAPVETPSDQNTTVIGLCLVLRRMLEYSLARSQMFSEVGSLSVEAKPKERVEENREQLQTVTCSRNSYSVLYTLKNLPEKHNEDRCLHGSDTR